MRCHLSQHAQCSTLPSMKAIPLLLSLSGCARVHVVPTPAAVAMVAPTDAPAPPQEPPRNKAESMNTEYYLGSAEEEAASFAAFADRIQAIQDKQAADHDQPVQRGFHAKAHGCLQGTIEVLADRDARTRYGIFADGAESWPVWVRFSNGVGWSQPDKALDARGMAVKVMGVPGDKLLPDEAQTQDFLMTNGPAPMGKNAEEFMGFAERNARGTLPTLLFGARHPRTVAPSMAATGPVDSMVDIQYWSGGAYHLGAHQAVKFTARACEASPRETSRKDPDYLSADLAAAAQEGLCFVFSVQLQVDPKRTPIEDAARVWEPSVAPELPVARIVLPPQDPSDPALEAFCRDLSFNPWHALPAHQPMGHINRARRVVYAASADHRGTGEEPRAAQVPASPAEAPIAPAPAP